MAKRLKLKPNDPVRHKLNGWTGRVITVSPNLIEVRFAQVNIKSTKIHIAYLEKVEPLTREKAWDVLTIEQKHNLTTPLSSYDIDTTYLFECKVCGGMVSEIDGFIIGSLFTNMCKS